MTPKVSVCVVTYNQEKFIGECLQSLVDQATTFDFEIIVGDDCSTDRTPKILREFEKRYPALLRVIYHERNVGPTANFLAVHQAAKGEYVAHLDGDDCASPGKLQAQADCLDANADVSFAVHGVTIIGTQRKIGRNQYPIKGTLSDLLRLGTYFMHSTVMYRRSRECEHRAGKEIVDFYFHVERASHGLIYFDDRILGGYRIHPDGVSQNMGRRKLIEQCYEDAFDRALELGAPVAAVRAARLHRRMAFAIAWLLAGDVASYKEKIFLHRHELPHASKKHVLLHHVRAVPVIVRIYIWARALDLKNALRWQNSQ